MIVSLMMSVSRKKFREDIMTFYRHFNSTIIDMFLCVFPFLLLLISSFQFFSFSLDLDF